MIRYAQDGVLLHFINDKGEPISKQRLVKHFEIKESEEENYLELVITDPIINLEFWEAFKEVKNKSSTEINFDNLEKERGNLTLSLTREL